jgi:hypothetical protein
MTGGLSVSFRSTAADIPQELWARCFAAEIDGYFWHDLLDRSELGDQFHFEYAVVQRQAEPIAIAPMFLMDLPIDIATPPALTQCLQLVKRIAPTFYVQRTLFVGAPGTDEGALGMVAGVDLFGVVSAVHTAALERAKHAKASMLVWKDFPSQYWPALRAIAAERRLFELVSFPNTRIDQPGTDFDAYLRRLTTGNRSKFRRKLRLSRQAHDVRTTVEVGSDPDLIEQLWPLYQQTFAKAKLQFERLTKAFFVRAMAYEHCATIVLRDGPTDRPVAFMLCFVLGRRAVNKYIGIDYDYGQHSFLYFRLFEAFIRWAQATGASELQSGQTAYRPKLDLGHQLVPLNNFVYHRHWLVHHVFALVARQIGWETLDTGLREHVEAQARRIAGQTGGRAGEPSPAGRAPDRAAKHAGKAGDSTKAGRSIEQ